MDSRAQELIRQGDSLFGKKSSLLSLWQEIADNFYPERADFTASRSLGSEFADHLTNSYPLLARRDLGNSIGSILRPNSKEWMKMWPARAEEVDHESRGWLEWATGVQRRAMYDRVAQFTRATKEGDHDFAAFGQCVITVELNKAGDALLYRCWHLRDVAWCEGVDGAIDTVHRKWRPTARTLMQVFGNRVAQKVKEAITKDPYCEINCRHVVIPSDEYQGEKQWRTKYVSIYIDVDNGHVMEETGVRTMPYVIPRWQTVSGSQYAYSPATVCALPDARLIQSMTRVLLEAGEKAVTPPMLAVQEAIRSDISVFAGGITWVDAEYDERLGEVLRPITQDKSGLPAGMEMQEGIRQMIAEAFYLNKLSLPMMAGDMTAFEVGQRVQEYIRQAMPIFEPMEADYNGALCERTFDVLMHAGAFGPPDNIPEGLRGQDIEFRFESPLREAIGRQKGQLFLEAKSMLAAAVDLDASVAGMVDAIGTMRDVLEGIGVPAKWMRSEEEVQAIAEQNAQKQQAQEMLATMGQGAEVAEQLGRAGQQAGAMI